MPFHLYPPPAPLADGSAAHGPRLGVISTDVQGHKPRSSRAPESTVGLLLLLALPSALAHPQPSGKGRLPPWGNGLGDNCTTWRHVCSPCRFG